MDGPIDASYVQYAAEYVAYMHERFVQKHGTPGYAYVHPDVRKAQGWSKSVRSEPVLMLGYQHMYSRMYKCLIEHGSISHVNKVRWSPQEPLGVFLKWRKNLSTGGEYHLALDPFDNSNDERSDADTVEGHRGESDRESSDDRALPVANRAAGKEAPVLPADNSVKGKEVPRTKATAAIGKAVRKSKVNLKGDLPAEPEFLRINCEERAEEQQGSVHLGAGRGAEWSVCCRHHWTALQQWEGWHKALQLVRLHI